MRIKSTLLASAALGVLLAVNFGAMADAKTAKKHVEKAPAEDIKEEQIQGLTAEVEALKASLEQEAAARAQTEATAQAAKADADAMRTQLAEQVQTLPGEVKSAVAAAKPKTDKIYYKGITVTMGGFAAAEFVYRSHDETADIGSSYSSIPYANDRAGRTSSTTMTGRQSRYSLLAQGDINPTTQASFYGEFDFLGAAQTANSKESNSYQPRVRNLYGTVDWNDLGLHVLAGQNWSLATMNSKGISPRNETPPPTIEAQYVPGFVWARQPQVRITKNFGKEIWVAVSAENPQTTFGNVGTATGITATTTQAPTSQFFNGTNYSLNDIPDVVGKLALEEMFDGHSVHAEVFGIYRSFMDRVNSTGAGGSALLGVPAGNATQRTSGGGVGGGLAVTVVPKMLDLQVSGLTGKGVGRYGSAQIADVTASPDGKLQGINETMWLAGGTLHATPMLDIYAFAGEERAQGKTYLTPGAATVGFGYGTLTGSNNAGCRLEGGACSAVTKAISQVTVGGWDKVYAGAYGKVQIGLQYSYTEKTAFADATGFAPKTNENMVFTSFRYYPF